VRIFSFEGSEKLLDSMTFKKQPILEDEEDVCDDENPY